MALKKICLDAGHGGKDPGAVNKALGYNESHATLSIVKKIQDVLLYNGYQVKLTRDTDVYIPLTERCQISNTFGADAFISIHLNSYSDPKSNGMEVLRYPVVGDTTKRLATSVHKHLLAVTGFRDRGIKERSDLTVLKKTGAPAILVECGFISNSEEAKKLFDPDFQMQVAHAILAGVQGV